MRIESINIRNFRQYRNVDFSFSKKGAKDLHVILGKNGVGKTNVLNAITWCLYDKELHLGDKNTATEIINNSYVAERKECGSQNGTVSVKITISSDQRKLIAERTADYSIISERPIRVSDKFKVSIWENNDWRFVESDEETYNEIHKYIPEEISEYIFFDGEHLEHYFQEGQREEIKKGISNLTQATTIQTTIDTFDRYIKQELSPLLTKSNDDVISGLQKNVDDLTKDRDNKKVEVDEIKEQLTTCNQEISKFDDILQGNESVPEKVKELHEVEDKIKSLEGKKAEAQADLFKFTRDYYQLFAVYPQMMDFYKYIKAEERDGKLPPKIDKEIIASILHHKHCLICDTDLDKHAEEFVAKIQEKLNISSAVSAELNKAMTALSGYFDKLRRYKGERERLFNASNVIDDELSKADTKYQEISAFLKNFPDDKKITEAYNNREEFTKLKEELLQKLGRESGLLDSIEEDLNDAQAKLDKALEKSKGFEDVKLKKQFCNECITILKTTKKEILEECRSAMEVETMEIFERLLWKKGAFQRVTIDEDYVFSLIDNYGHQTLGSCSAAERALLALSFTLALQKTSKHDSLLFIDTPIGRVDEENRDNFIKTLLDIATDKQVILTFTPTEYDMNVRSLLHSNYSTFSEINMIESVTKIK